MKRGLIKRSMSNLISRNGVTEDPRAFFERKDLMPFAGEDCTGCGECASVCPVNAIDVSAEWTVDLGRCIFCGDCASACRTNAIDFVESPDYALSREDLIIRRSGGINLHPGTVDKNKLRSIGRSINIREVDTGSCNACEVEVNSLSNVFYDVERFGIKIVASPRHADVLLITGPLTENMHKALLKVVSATPDPKVLIAMGSCAISGGMFVGGSIVGEGINDTVAVDMFIPGCPPSPDKLIRAVLSAFDLIPKDITAQR